MRLRLFYMNLRSDQELPYRPDHLRGYLTSAFNEYTLLHQHIDHNQLRYRYPLVQYRVLDDTAVVIGINEGADVLQEIYRETRVIRFGQKVYQIYEKSVTVEEQDFGLSEKFHLYRFITPWIALNQQNYLRYLEFDRNERSELLRKTLTSNFLSASKGLGYHVPDRIKLDIRNISTCQCDLKGTPMIGFTGEFLVNFDIPDLLGLGKSVSRGYGAVRCIDRTATSRGGG
ncbi:CRISPR-associated endonuclease Cas6 [Methanoculleus sp. UBA303]|uniref:CRISPR-associated endonuclease Cas6 n=1 Tax=Methanoculleus sp. UBA303 TaxID=1915497 RepID=UPI003744067D